MGIPKDLQEAAEIDGASEMVYFFQILLPVCMPIIATIAMWQFVGMWTSYFDAMIYLNSASKQPLQLVLRALLIQFIMSVGNIMSVGFEKAYALQTDLNLNTSEIISTYVYKKGLLDGDYGFSTAVGLFNTVINVILLVSMNALVKRMNEGKGI
jgi:ABC-type polysaccharide transport system permease subunit